MIRIYGLSYHSLKFFKKSINSMIETASEPVSFVIADNLSPESDKIREYGHELVRQGKISKFIGMKNNSMIRSFNWMYEYFPPDSSEDFFMMTELDIVVPQGCDWIKETREMQKRASLTGFPLSLDNYIPPNRGHMDADPLFGIWLMGINRDRFAKEYKSYCKETGLALSDRFIRSVMMKYGKAVRSQTRLYHLGWDLHKEPGLENYWEVKDKGKINWDQAPKVEVDVIYG